MQEIPIRTTLTDLKFQYSTIGKIESKAVIKGHIKGIIGIGVATAAYFGLMLTDTNSMLPLKAILSILLALAWIIYIIYYLWHFIKQVRKKALIKILIGQQLNEKIEHFLSFDTKRIVVRTENQKLEFNWEHFVAYYDTDTSVFLFPEGNIYSAWSFTESEIGKQHVESLKAIVENKINRLKIESA